MSIVLEEVKDGEHVICQRRVEAVEAKRSISGRRKSGSRCC